MSIWNRIRGHDGVKARFEVALKRGRLASTFLFFGPPGIGKRTFALTFAQCLLCHQRDDNELEACGECPSCIQAASGSNPDVIVVSKPVDRSLLPIDLLIGEREKRNQEGLCHAISLKPFHGRRKIAIIDDADFLNEEGANCLLKTLEEPPAGSILILISSSPQRQLSTIRSRCQSIQFRPLPLEAAADLLLESDAVDDREQAKELAKIGSGSLESAQIWREEEYQTFRADFLPLLGRIPFSYREFVKEVEAFVNGAGSEAASKRERLVNVVDLVAAFYSHAAIGLTGHQNDMDNQMKHAVLRFTDDWTGPVEVIVDCADTSLDIEWQTRSNATLAGLIEFWGNELSQLLEGQTVRAVTV